MKTPLALLVALCAALPVLAQAPAGGILTGPYSSDELDQLVGPIALYPDPLVALILPASTVPSDISQAASYIAANGSPAGIDGQPWDPSVKGLAHYPQVVTWMNANLVWTQTLGAAFAEQPSDVMKSIQQMRARALADGALTNTPQQQVDQEGDDIRIIPGQADEICVPEYDPDVVYDEPPGYPGPFLTFGPEYPVGPWLGYECDWDDFGIWIGPWIPGWAYHRDWASRNGNPWRIDPSRWRNVVGNYYPGVRNVPVPVTVRRPGTEPSGRPRVPVAAPSPRPDYRGWGGQAAPQAPEPAPSGALYGGYDRGTDTRAYSNRGQESRAAPVRSYSAPARAPAPSGGGHERH